MKKLFLWLTAMLTMASCSITEEQMVELDEDNEIKLCSEVSQMTRSNNLELQSTQIVPGQMLGVYIYNASHAMNNSPWLVGENGSLTNQRGKIYWNKNNNIDIVAYQPYLTDDELAKGIFTVKTDQSTDKMYQESDLLLASRSAAKQVAPVPLTFYHKLSKVMVRIIADDAHFLDGAEVWVCGTKISTPFNPNECSITAINPVSDIKAAVLTESQLTAAAIVIPQTIGADSKLIRVKVGDRMFFYRLKEEVTFESGYSYLYTLHLSLDNDAIKLVSYQLIDWNEERRELIHVDKGVEPVDLGLPSGTLWAPYNVGAENEEEPGQAYQWGMTIPTNYGEYYHPIYMDDMYEKENIRDLIPEHDAASCNWGIEWHIPTIDEAIELMDNTTKEVIIRNDRYLLKLTGSNGNSIYLTPHYDIQCNYWTSSQGHLTTNSPWDYNRACYFSIYTYNGDDNIYSNWGTNHYNWNIYIRPVFAHKKPSSVE